MSTDLGRTQAEGALTKLAPQAEIREELAGGASTRRFFRTEFQGQSAILMFAPAPSQEIAKARQNSGNGSFLAMRALLDAIEIPVPQIYSAEVDHSVLVEDLGPYTLAEYLRIHPEEKNELYQHAIKDLARARLAFDGNEANTPFVQRAFDEELLRWEVEHFKEWVLLARGVTLSPSESAVFDRAANYLSEQVAALPRGFVHRDYQSRNLMVLPQTPERRLVWIDFQDAMMGPRAYDLVALLTDSYQEFEEAFVQDCLQAYIRALGHSPSSDEYGAELSALRREFDLISVQRKLKDAGRFIFVDRVNGNPHFLKYVGRSIERAKDALKRLGDIEELHALLALIEAKVDEHADFT